MRFTCQPGCTKCCDQKGFVYLTEADVEKAARYVGMEQGEFEARYVYRTRHLRRLRKPRDRQCAFLGAEGCGIHPAKPTQCRLFPFWPDLLADRKLWRQTGEWCPGIGQGPLIQIGAAMEIAEEMKSAYPDSYMTPPVRNGDE